MDNIDSNITAVAQRIFALREIIGISAEKVADELGIPVAAYRDYEAAKNDFSISFLYKLAKIFGVDVTDILIGEGPKLSTYAVTKSEKGLPVERRTGFKYQALSFLFKDKIFNPYMVFTPYSENQKTESIELSTHPGQEFDLVISGSLKFIVHGKVEILEAGDSIYLDSSTPHGMVAINPEGCRFLAIVTEV